MRLSAYCALVAALLTPGCPGGASESSTLRVAAASDLRFVLGDLAEALERRSPIQIEPTFGASGTLTAQIEQGAPFDVFLAADERYPEALAAAGRAHGPPFRYGRGSLVLWSRQGSGVDIGPRGLRVLMDAPGARLVIANPEHAPYGRLARGALERAGLWSALQDRVVVAENAAQAAQLVQSGAADAGLIPRSLAMSEPLRGGRWVELGSDLAPPLPQAGVILRSTGQLEAARQLRELLLGPEGQRILSEHGLLPPDPGVPQPGSAQEVSR